MGEMSTNSSSRRPRNWPRASAYAAGTPTVKASAVTTDATHSDSENASRHSRLWSSAPYHRNDQRTGGNWNSVVSLNETIMTTRIGAIRKIMTSDENTHSPTRPHAMPIILLAGSITSDP